MKHFITDSKPMRPKFNSMAEHQAQPFTFAFDSGFATLSLNRPDRKNPLAGHVICMQMQDFKRAFNAFLANQKPVIVGD